ncbi:hypothetical protein EKO04_002084 [Ascochyta lentis]|uniref:Uncharacterized protein n=1 Tax=Ascochyta lentis TaxID=205686 RepID=A0A8H7JBD0_9PLEO|nr:hypothetical protein EKO04_002084 [Ascochyta lentis]
MQVIATPALAALLITSVSGNVFSNQVAGCGSKAFSTSEGIAGSNARDACRKWIEGANSVGTPINTPFKIASTGTSGTASIEYCTSAVDLLIEQCFKNGIFYGGSVNFHGIYYTIEDVETSSNLLEARAGRKKKPAPKASTPKASTPKASKPKASTPKGSKPTPTPKSACKLKARPKGGAKLPTTPKGAKPPTTPKEGAAKTLTGRALLLELIQRTVFEKRSKKSGEVCDLPFDAMEYPPPADVRKKQQSAKLSTGRDTPVLKYAFADCDDVDSWTYGVADPKTLNKGLDTEHILERQTVTGFFDHLNTKYKSKWCESYKT